MLEGIYRSIGKPFTHNTFYNAIFISQKNPILYAAWRPQLSFLKPLTENSGDILPPSKF